MNSPIRQKGKLVAGSAPIELVLDKLVVGSINITIFESFSSDWCTVDFPVGRISAFVQVFINILYNPRMQIIVTI